tara:strand:- start:902 stop:4210 length:3309 start_codon:yes stop_codon:yes gene_type:complete
MSQTPENYYNTINIFLEKLKKQEKNVTPELEVKFGTLNNSITKTDFDNVAKKLKSCNFDIIGELNYLNISLISEFVREEGDFISNLRTQIKTDKYIQKYCNENNISDFIDDDKLIFITKKYDNNLTKEINIIENSDFNFRCVLNDETTIDKNNGDLKNIISQWNDLKKNFRLMNRVTFAHKDYPFKIDLSIVRTSKQSKNRKKYEATYSFDESNVLNSYHNYEIEIEFDNEKIYNEDIDVDTLYNKLKKCIMYISSGLQETNYPVSIKEQYKVLENYFKIIKQKEQNKSVRVSSKHFIGPSSMTLQLENIIKNEQINIPNILNNYTVTDKADGLRKLLFINNDGKIYLLDTLLKVQFTGCKTKNKKFFNTIADGEHILLNKFKKFENTLALFDIYYVDSLDIRKYDFYKDKKNNSGSKSKENKTRHEILVGFTKEINIASLTNNNKFNLLIKSFYPIKEDNLFNSCNNLLKKVNSMDYSYETDGLIFTPNNISVGTNDIDEEPRSTRVAWEYSFKWKPPEFNTIDFLIKIIKDNNGEDVINNQYIEGKNLTNGIKLHQYKTLNLYVGFDEYKHGFLNPCMNIIDGIFDTDKDKSDNYKPAKFIPNNPSDPEAYICNLYIKTEVDGINSGKMVTKENEIIEDNTIIEFSYKPTEKEGFKWEPLRVRYDKTAEYRNGGKNYGNAYHTAVSNWHSIHYPITKEMLSTGKNIPNSFDDDDVYYNKVIGSSKTRALRDFHNLYVKNLLISKVSNKGNSLIDYAVGKGGDIPKWSNSRLGFVLGIDLSKDNIENRIDGACARFLKNKRKYNTDLDGVFVNGDGTKNIKNLDALFTQQNKNIINALFGNGERNRDELGKGIYNKFGIVRNNFNISSIQFALHYMFEDVKTLHSFLRNVSECTKVNGYFVGTCFDGKRIFELLKDISVKESITIFKNNEETEKIWEITKGYNKESFKDDETSLGYTISIFQDSINKKIEEYLVNFEYLELILNNYGFRVLNNDELKKMNLIKSYDSFEKLYNKMTKDVEKNNKKKKDLNKALNMTEQEKHISFLNNYFIFKKEKNVDTEEVYNSYTNDLTDKIKESLKIKFTSFTISKPVKIKNKKIVLI